MSKCQENCRTNCESVITPKKTNFGRDCRCFEEYKQLKNNLKMLKDVCGCCHNTKVIKPNKRTEQKCQKENLPYIKNKNKTWLEVLRESPSKNKKERHHIQTEDIPQKLNEFSSTFDKINRNAVQNIDLKSFNIFLNDEDFLKKLIQFNHILQTFCTISAEKFPNVENSLQSNNIDPIRNSNSTSARATKKIDTSEKYNSQKTNIKNLSVNDSKKCKENEDVQIKALVKLLENMQSINENSEKQSDSIENLTRSIIKLRNENKMVNELKDIRINLESKLASLSTENIYLKKQLQLCEEERDKANQMLQIKENDILTLKKQISSIRVRIDGKIDSGINYDMDEASFELHNLHSLNDTIASLPKNNESFDLSVRPASSSPIEDMEKWKDRNGIHRVEDDDSGIQSNPLENSKLRNQNIQSAARIQTLSELNENVKKTMRSFQSDLKLQDLSLNLSDATYKLSLSSLV